MALCLADSLLACGGFDPLDQLKRYCRWWHQGYLSSTDRCFDIGGTIRGSLARFEETGEPYPGDANQLSLGNGSLMRLAPCPLYFAADPARAVRRAADSSRVTHGSAGCVDACRYFAGLLTAAVYGLPKDRILNNEFEAVVMTFLREPLGGEVAAVAGGSFQRRNPPQIRGTGHVVRTLEAALWAFHRTDNFRDGALMVVNLGEDSDTTGAVYGQLAGAYYGEEGIPAGWLAKLAKRDAVEDFADRLHAAAGLPE
jgi:ADP-ribosylglycohydrolase